VMPCRLQSVPLMFVGADRCSQAQRRLHVTPATGWQLCATPTSMAARNTCTGDSGSPVLSVDPPATVLGIVSWGPTCALHDVGVYTDTAPLASWIRMLRTAGALRLDE
jgi:secreted trypsin-like serine protease